MFPDLSYLWYYASDIPPDGKLSLIKTYGLFLFLGIYFAGLVFKILFQKQLIKGDVFNADNKFTKKFYNNVVVFAAVGGIIGSKLLALCEYDASIYKNGFINAIFYKTGISFLGGLLLASLLILGYFKLKKIPFLPALDCCGPAVLVGYGFGRLGCHLSGDGDWGIVASSIPNWWFFPNWVWKFDFPNNVIRKGVPMLDCDFKYNTILQEAVFPTSLYESFFSLVSAAVLIFCFYKTQKTGLIFIGFLLYLSLSRFFIEFIRVNPKYDFFGILFSQAQIISLVLFFVSIILFIKVLRE